MRCALAALALGPLPACDDDEDEGGVTAKLAFPTAAGSTLVVIDTETREALIVDAGEADGGTLEARSVALPGETLWAAPRNRASAALVLSAGLRGVGQGGVLSQLTEDGTLTSYALGGAFDAVQQSDDGRFAIAHVAQGGDGIVFSPNELAVVDLDGDGPSAERLSLSLPGGVPLSMSMSPAMTVDGSTVHLAAVLSDNHISLLELGRADSPELSVRLGTSAGPGRVTPTQVVFDAAGGRVLVRGEGSDDLYVLTLQPGDERLTATVDVWPAGDSPSDMAAFAVGEDTHVLAVSDSGPDVRLVQLPDGQDVTIPMDVDANRIVDFTDGDARPQALAYRTDSPWAALLDLDGLADDPADRTRVLKLQEPIRRLQVLRSRAMAIVDHGPAVLGMLDLIGGGEQLLGIHGGQGAAPIVIADDAIESLWVGTPGQHLVGFAVLETGRTGEVLLEAPIAAMAPVADAGRVAVVHDDGTVTLLDSDNPGRQGAVRIVVR